MPQAKQMDKIQKKKNLNVKTSKTPTNETKKTQQNPKPPKQNKQKHPPKPRSFKASIYIESSQLDWSEMFLPASLSVPAAANASDSTGSSSGRGLGHKEIIVKNLL